MSKSRPSYSAADDVDLATLGSALWRAKGWIFGLTLGVGVITFIGLSMMRPLYTSEARIFIQNDESAFTKPTTEEGYESVRSALDEQAVQSPVQVLTSRDLLRQVVKDLDLKNNAAFAKDAGQTLLKRMLSQFGLGRGTPESEEEKSANALADHLDVFQLWKSSVIAVEYTSGDPALAAKVANKLADVYIAWQREAKIAQTKDATAWLKDQIEVLRAHASVLQSFPKRGPITALVMAATALLALAYVLAKELIQGTAMQALLRTREPRHKRRTASRHWPARVEPEIPEEIPTAAMPETPSEPARPASAKRASSVPKARKLPVVVPALKPESVAVRHETQDESEPVTVASARPSWQAKPPPKRPSWLRVSEPRSPRAEPDTAASSPEPEPQTESDMPPAESNKPRCGFAFLDRLRRGRTGEADTATELSLSSRSVEMSAPSPNDLRNYLTQRIASSDVDEMTSVPPAPKVGHGKVGPVLRSLDAVLEGVLASTTGGLPRAVLVAGVSSKANSPQVAIELARSFVDRNEQVVLVDFTKGAAAVSGQLGMPRVPGFADLAAGRASFTDVIHVDEDTPLQVIPTGNPTVRDGEPEPDRFMRVFEALTQTYGCVVLHADLAAAQALMPTLKFELPVMVAVTPRGASVEGEADALSTFQTLGCPVLVYEGNGKQRRMRLFSRSAAV